MRQLELMQNGSQNRARRSVPPLVWATVAALVLAISGALAPSAGASVAIHWTRHHIPVRDGVAGSRLCQVTADAGSQIKSVRFSSPASPRVRVLAAGRPHRRGDSRVFSCRIETRTFLPPQLVRVRATARDVTGETDSATATAVIKGPVPRIANARAVVKTKKRRAAPVQSSPPTSTGATGPTGLPFSPTSFWNRPLSASAPLVPQSAAYVQELVNDVGATSPWINTTEYSTPVYVVGPTQATTKVTISGGSANAGLQAALNAVPLPANAVPAAGTDHHLVVWQPATNAMWEFWEMHSEGGHWAAGAAGAMNDVATSPGYFGPDSWPGGQSWWGATATGLPLLGGLIRLGELESGTIPHALAIAIPNTASSYVWPAQRGDGHNSSASAIPEGTTFRLPTSVNVESLGLPPAARAIAVAAQKYGIVVRDTGGDVSFFAEDPTPLGINPYSGLFGGLQAATLLAHFPWSQLVAVQQTG
jgi:hypothetical protein